MSARRAALFTGLLFFGRVPGAWPDDAVPRPKVALDWTRAPGAERCLSPEDLVARMRARTAHTVLGLDRKNADFLVEGRIEARPNGYRTVLLLEDAAGHLLGTRTLDSTTRSCPALDESILLALEMLVDTPKLRDLARAKLEAPAEPNVEPTTDETTAPPAEMPLSPPSNVRPPDDSRGALAERRREHQA